MCAADPTGISHLFGTDSLQLHLVTYTELVKYTQAFLLRVYIRWSERNLLLSYMCAADPTGISYSFGIDSLQPHSITYTELDQSLTGDLHRIVRKKFVVFVYVCS